MTEPEIGRLTLRKFYLLLAEWYAAERLRDARAYKLLCAHLAKAPEPGEVFPLLKSCSAEPDDEDEDEIDDDASFRQVAAALIPHGE